MSWDISLLYFLGKTFLRKEHTTVQNFRLLTTQVKFHQTCTLIGYFWWKYIKFQLRKVWRKYISWYQRVVENLKKNLFFVSKMTIIWWILIWALKILKKLNFDCFLLCNVWLKKVQRSYISRHWRAMQNLKKKLTRGLENDMRCLGNFDQNTWKSQNWYLHGILLYKVENTWATKLQKSDK